MALTEHQRKNLETLNFDTLNAEELAEALELVSKEVPAEPGSGSPEPEPEPEPGTEPEPGADPEPAAPAPAAPKSETKEEKDRIAQLKAEKFKADSEANRYKQQLESLQRKMSEQAETKAAPAPEIDPWDTNHQRKMASKVQEMDAEMKYIREQRQALDAEKARESTYKEAEDLAREFNLPVDVRAVDADLKAVAARVNRMPTVDELAAECGSRDAAEAYLDLLGAFDEKKKSGYPKARAAFKDMDLDAKWSKRGDPAWMTKQSSAEGHTKTVKEAAARGKVMPSSYSGKETGFNAEWANQWITKMGDRMDSWTKEDHQTFKKIQDKVLK